jgi:hypothetical protein
MFGGANIHDRMAQRPAKRICVDGKWVAVQTCVFAKPRGGNGLGAVLHTAYNLALATAQF